MRPAPIFRCLCVPLGQKGDTEEGKVNGPDFRVSHEPIGKADCDPMRCERAVCVLLCDGVHVRRRAFLDGIALQAFLGSDTPTIMHTVPA
jgi:hypothetical protein